MHSFRNSILKLAFFSIIPFAVVCYAVYLTGKKTDDFYKRFTSPQQNALILGSSRAAHINPAILDSVVKSRYPNVKFYNYSFTAGHSPYGPSYLESIKKKLNPKTKNSLFLVTVEPSILMVNKNKPDSPEYYFENDKSLAETYFVNLNPNIPYLIKNYDYSITKVLNDKIRPPVNPMAIVNILDNGKVDVNSIRDYSPSAKAIEMKRKMVLFQNKINDLKWSENRVKYLGQTIQFLQKHGKVILVRDPIDLVPYKIEETKVPYFDEKMQQLAKKYNVSYTNFNLTSNNYKYMDLVHFTRESADKFTIKAGQKMLEN